MPTALRAAVLTASLAGAVTACRREDPGSPEAALGVLQRSLATGRPAFATVAAPQVLAEARVLSDAQRLQEEMHVPMSDSAFVQIRGDTPEYRDPVGRFRGVLRLLGRGRCVRIGDAPLPNEISPVPPPGERWPSAMRSAQISIARRVQNAIAGDYRCDPGLSFGAAFVRADPDDGRWRVAWIGPARRR